MAVYRLWQFTSNGTNMTDMQMKESTTDDTCRKFNIFVRSSEIPFGIQALIESECMSNRYELVTGVWPCIIAGSVDASHPILMPNIENGQLAHELGTVKNLHHEYSFRATVDVCITLMLRILPDTNPKVVAIAIDVTKVHTGSMRYMGDDIFPDWLVARGGYNITDEQLQEFMETY